MDLLILIWLMKTSDHFLLKISWVVLSLARLIQQLEIGLSMQREGFAFKNSDFEF